MSPWRILYLKNLSLGVKIAFLVRRKGLFSFKFVSSNLLKDSYARGPPGIPSKRFFLTLLTVTKLIFVSFSPPSGY